MRKVSLLLLLCLPASVVWSQNYNAHSWIQSGQTYLKISGVSTSGVYRLPGSKLLANPEFANANPDVRNLHLMYRGQEIAVYIQDNNGNNRLDADDFIEWFGQVNGGEDDDDLFRNYTDGRWNAAARTNPYRSIYSTASFYFLTWNNILRAGTFTYTNETTPPDYATLPQQTFFRHTVRRDYVSQNYTGVGNQNSLVHEQFLNSDYIAGEGVTGPAISSPAFQPNSGGGANTTTNVLTSFPYTGSTRPVEVQLRMTSASRFGVKRQRVQFGSVTQEYITPAMESNVRSFTATIADVASGVPNIAISTFGDAPDIINVPFIRVVYDRLTRFNNDAQAHVPWTNTNLEDKYFRFESMNLSGQGMVYDLTNRRRITGVVDGSNLHAVVRRAFAPEHDMWVTSTGTIENTSTNLQVTTALATPHARPNAGAQFVIIAARSFSASAEAYAQYRTGRFSTKVVYVDDLQDEFAYGNFTPIAIKRFMQYALTQWTVRPQHVLLWGPPSGSNNAYVYTWGYPPTDYEYVSNFDGNNPNYVPLAGIGRVNVRDNAQGQAYLSKVQEYEAMGNESWMKQGLFFGGGTTSFEHNTIENTLRDMMSTFENCPFAGTGYLYQKRSTTGTQNEATPEVTQAINDGNVAISFFGHSNAVRWDLEILPPQLYTNYHKYPFIYAAGCYTGNYAAGNWLGQQWVLEPDRGAIGWLSNTDLGLLSQLRNYMRVLYDNAFRLRINQPLSSVIGSTISSIRSTDGSYAARNHIRQICLHGDPSVILKNPLQPDLVLTEADVKFDPASFGSENDSVTVILTPRNLGICFADSFDVRVVQTVGNEVPYTHPLKRFPPYAFTDTLRIRLRNQGITKPGPSRYEICLDAENVITELDETNNCVTLERFIPSLVPSLVYPWPYAVINKQGISLRAATYGITRQENLRYVFEIDTVYEFSTPAKRSAMVISNTLGAEWKLPAPYEQFRDSTVYYWRVRLADNPEVIWATGSFQYINGPKEGWAQARPPQFFENSTSRVQMNRQTRRWQFEPVSRNLTATVSPYSIDIDKTFCNTSDQPAILPNNTILLLGINHKTLECYGFNIFLGNAEWIRLESNLQAITAIVNSMPQGDYLVLVGRNVDRNLLTPAFFQALQQLGISNQLTTVPPMQGSSNFHFSLMGRKGSALGQSIEVYGTSASDPTRLSARLFSSQPQGTVTSVIAGPSGGWQDLIWDWKRTPNEPNEQVTVDLVGVRTNNTETTLLSNLQPGTYDISGYPVADYPYMRLRGTLQDPDNRTAPQLDNWYLLYQELPDAAIDPYVNFSFHADTVLQGETVRITLNARNLSQIDMDSLLVSFQVRGENGAITTVGTWRGPRLLANQTSFPIAFSFSTFDFPGQNTLIVTINPNNDQPEKYFFNNVYNQAFFVRKDIINPILDVTFDGRHIMDGDIVAPTPQIVVQLNDENPYYLMTDPAAFEVYFKKDNLDEGDRGDLVDMNSGLLTFEPATTAENKARITFSPQRLEDGDYVLTVNGQDVNGNLAGRVRYRVKFRVMNESTITDVINYPNPFSTCTRFVYTLTGDVMPEVFQVQIYTVTGKQVKTIDLKAEGEVFVGQHITQYCWDGTDEFGDKLANGVYLYRVNFRLPGNTTVRKNDEATSKYFEKGWGKMYIMR
ncbi:MAG: hypothetical protein KF690_06300 [Bacteroidetes bacterium]|nr:hypothetical protein [Bacteroidota bacterium]